MFLELKNITFQYITNEILLIKDILLHPYSYIIILKIYHDFTTFNLDNVRSKNHKKSDKADYREKPFFNLEFIVA